MNEFNEMAEHKIDTQNPFFSYIVATISWKLQFKISINDSIRKHRCESDKRCQRHVQWKLSNIAERLEKTKINRQIRQTHGLESTVLLICRFSPGVYSESFNQNLGIWVEIFTPILTFTQKCKGPSIVKTFLKRTESQD